MLVGTTICIFTIFKNETKMFITQTGFLCMELALRLVVIAVGYAQTNLSVVTMKSIDIIVSLEMKNIYV